jgi:hypothetical protein
MRVKEFAYSDEQINLWNQLNRPILNSISDENLPQAQKPSKIDKLTKKVNGKPATVPQREPTKSTKQFKSTARSNRATPSQQSSTSQSQTNPNTLQQRQKHDPNSVANTQRLLDPFATNDVVKRLTS